MATNIEVLASRRGRPLLTFNGNIFQFERDGLEKKTWRCDQFQKCKCRFRLHTSDNLRNPELLRQVGSHNHEPKPIACDAKKVMTKIRQAASSSSIAPAQLIANEVRQMPAASQGHMPLAHNIKRGIRKVRGVTTGSLIVPSKREDIKLPDSFKITSNNENFLAFDSGSHADRIMIFSTARNLEFLSQCNVWLVDGTFKSSPVLFDQLFILHGMRNESTFPLIYCLTPNRTSGTYIRLLSEIKKLQPNLDPTTILSDYEKASIRAMEDIFPQAEKNGCFFHYSQCIFRNIQKHPDIHNLYSNDSNFSLMMKHLRSLAFVPPDDVVMSFDLLMEDEFFTTNEIILTNFIRSDSINQSD
ncbi:AKT-interacting protein [Folsomia candida]|uniref:AKT-interacting protein n=1 Tax=Folsomia candida TaxID=158441 RepID=A0A226ENY6_FOLCA|nr:AKT-interacting protein [Folsomia candida]